MGLLSPTIIVYEKDNLIHIEGLLEKTLYKDIEKSDYARLLTIYLQDIFRKGLIFHKLVLTIPSFFGLEMLLTLEGLLAKKKRSMYIDAYNGLLQNTWLRSLRLHVPEIDMSRIEARLKFPLKDYQVKSLQIYQTAKVRLQLNGYILALEQGLGKTFTALANAMYIGNPVIVIVCPKSLVTTWRDEIHKVLKLHKYAIEIVGEVKPSKTANFIIANYERVKHIDDYLPSDQITLIVDECHNIRYMTTLRAKQLKVFADKYGIHDIMALSGTPIKGLVTELIPILYILDDKFDKEAEIVFKRVFRVYRPLAYNILRRRLSLMMHRELKEQVLPELPRKIEKTIYLHVPDSEKYTVPYLRDRIKEYVAWRVPQLNKQLKKHARDLISYYHLAYKRDYITRKEYKHAVKTVKILLHSNIWSIDPAEYKKYLEIFKKTRAAIKKELGMKDVRYLEECKSGMAVFVKAVAEAVGKIYTKAKQNLVLDIIEHNIDRFIGIINDAEKKVIFFSKFVKPVYFIADKLKDHDIKCIPITGECKDLADRLKLFKESNDYLVLSATIGKLSTGVTLIVANTVVFLDLPYRDADFRQAEDRVHRLGQDSDVYIYKVLLDTGNIPNVSIKSDQILLWSREMFEAVFGPDNMATNLKEEVGDDIDVYLSII